MLIFKNIVHVLYSLNITLLSITSPPLLFAKICCEDIFISDLCPSPSLSPSLFERTSLRPYLVASVPNTGVLNVCKAIKNWTVGRLGNKATQHTPNGKKVTLINHLYTKCFVSGSTTERVGAVFCSFAYRRRCLFVSCKRKC